MHVEKFSSNSLSFRQTSTSVRSCRACARGERASTPLEASSVNVLEDTLSTQTPECAKVSQSALRLRRVHGEGNWLRPLRNGLMDDTWERRENVPMYLKTLNNNRPPCLHQSHYLMRRHNSLTLLLNVARQRNSRLSQTL